MPHFTTYLTIGGLKSNGIFDRYFEHLFIFRNRLPNCRNSFISDLRGFGWKEKPARVYKKFVMRRQHSNAIDGVEKN